MCTSLGLDSLQFGWALVFYARWAVFLHGFVLVSDSARRLTSGRWATRHHFLKGCSVVFRRGKQAPSEQVEPDWPQGKYELGRRVLGILLLGASWQLPEQVQYRCRLWSYNAAFTRTRIFCPRFEDFSHCAITASWEVMHLILFSISACHSLKHWKTYSICLLLRCGLTFK